MFDRFRRSIFAGWNSDHLPELAVPEPVVPPPDHGFARLERLLGSTFEECERLAEGRAAGGLCPGRIIGDGRTLHAKSYASAVEAGVDFIVAQMEESVETAERYASLCRLDAQAAAHAEVHRLRANLADVQRLAPIVAAWRIERDLRALEGIEAPEAPARAPERPATAPSPPAMVGLATSGFDANVRGLSALRSEIEQQQRDGMREKFEVRNASRAGRAAPNLDDPIGERISLQCKLAAWVATHPDLAAEIAETERT